MKLILFWFLFLMSLNFFSQEIDKNTVNFLAKNPEVLQQINQANNQLTFDEPTGSDKSIDFKTDSDEPTDSDKSIDFKIDSFNFSEKSDKFGFDYVKTIPTSISSTSDLPVPNDYVISLGDKIRIILTGSKKDSFILAVGLDGSILFPELGLINVFVSVAFTNKSFNKTKLIKKNIKDFII